MAASALVAGAVAVGVGDVLGEPPAPEPVAAPTRSSTPPPAPTAVPSSAAPSSAAPPSAAPPSAAPSAPARTAEESREGLDLAVPALGLEADVREVSPEGGVIDPPTFDHAYVIAPYGRPGSDNTTYIAGHSWNRGDAVFNPLLDVPTQEGTLEAGDIVELTQDGETFTYEVTSSVRYPKGSLADEDEVWRAVPGRLVLITCFQRNDGARSRDNLVVTAELVEPAQARG